MTKFRIGFISGAEISVTLNEERYQVLMKLFYDIAYKTIENADNDEPRQIFEFHHEGRDCLINVAYITYIITEDLDEGTK